MRTHRRPPAPRHRKQVLRHVRRKIAPEIWMCCTPQPTDVGRPDGVRTLRPRPAPSPQENLPASTSARISRNLSAPPEFAVALETARVAQPLPQNFGQLSQYARQALRRMRKRPSLVIAFWRQAKLFPL